jgi:hypothetical protein
LGRIFALWRQKNSEIFGNFGFFKSVNSKKRKSPNFQNHKIGKNEKTMDAMSGIF